MQCSYGDSRKAEGICKDCPYKSKFLCKNHFNEHLKSGHSLALMEDHEIENEILMNSTKLELLGQIDKIENESIIYANTLISTIEKSLATRSEYLVQQRIKIMNLQLQDLNEYASLNQEINKLSSKLSSLYLMR